MAYEAINDVYGNGVGTGMIPDAPAPASGSTPAPPISPDVGPGQ